MLFEPVLHDMFTGEIRKVFTDWNGDLNQLNLILPVGAVGKNMAYESDIRELPRQHSAVPVNPQGAFLWVESRSAEQRILNDEVDFALVDVPILVE